MIAEEELQALRCSLSHKDDTFLGGFHRGGETYIPDYFRTIPIYRNKNCFLTRRKPGSKKVYKKPVWVGIPRSISSHSRIVCHPSLVSNWRQACKLHRVLGSRVV